MQAFLKPSLVFHKYIIPATSPATAAITNPIGLADIAAFNNHCAAVTPSFANFQALNALTTAVIALATLRVNIAVPIAIIPVAIVLLLSSNHVNPSTIRGSHVSTPSAILVIIFPNASANLSMLPPKSPLFKLSAIFPRDSIAVSAAVLRGPSNFSYICIPKPSSELPKIVILPCRLSFMVSAMSAAAPSQLAIYPLNSSNLSPELAKSALTDFKSTLLNILFNTCVCSPCVIVESVPLRSLNISFIGLILPSASRTCKPKLFIASAAVSVGAVKLKIIFLSAVPPSAPLIPLSAKIPRTVFISSTPPDRTLAVPPTVNIA